MNTKIVGDCGEHKAVEYLKQKGYEILSNNWRTRDGEIDIIAYIKETVVFAEVKTLPNCTSDMLEKVLNAQKQSRIVKTSKRFLLNHRQYSNSYVRYDVILLDAPGFPDVYHIENAFTERI